MESVGVRQLRNDVAALLRRAAAGERVVITVDGAPIAQLGPLESEGAPTLDDLVAGGLVDPPRRPLASGDEPTTPIDLAVDVRLDAVHDDLRGGSYG